MSRFVLSALLLAVASPLAFANYMIIRVVIDSVPGEGSTPSPAVAGGEGSSPPFLPGRVPPGGDAPPVLAGEGGLATSTPETQTAPPLGDPSRSVVVLVPVVGKLGEKRVFDDRKSRNNLMNPEWDYIRHKLGVTFLFTDSTHIFLHPEARPSRERQIRDRYDEWTVKKQSPNVLYEIANEALAAGMTTEAELYCDKLLSLTQGKTTGLSPEVQRFAKAYGAIGPKLKMPAAQAADADAWKDQLAILGNANVQKYMHYAMVYWDVPSEDVNRRLKSLEENFKAFYLWHALRGLSPKVPEKPLPVILATDVREVSNLFRALDATSITTDGFFSAEHGVLVLSPGHLDPVGSAFDRMMRTTYGQASTTNPMDIVKGKGPEIKGDMRPETVARLTTLALVDHTLRADAEAATISREGSRQLLHATGALPRHVPLPRWLDSGYGTLFEQARLPVFTGKDTETPHMTLALNRGMGAPHYAMYKYYREFIEGGELDTDGASRLKKVLQDDYFTAIRTGIDIDARKTTGRPLPPDPKADAAKLKAALTEKLTNKANATAWALVYFLANQKPAELLALGQELEHLPHDVPLDAATLRLAFGRAFKLLKEDGVTFDDNAVKALGKSWDDSMNTVRQTTFDVAIPKPKPPQPTQPPMPGGTVGDGNP